MKFEEKFPELKPFVVEWCETGNLANRMKAVSWMRIDEFCLSKQRVKEAIEKLKYVVGGTSTTEVCNAKILLKELGVEGIDGGN